MQNPKFIKGSACETLKLCPNNCDNSPPSSCFIIDTLNSDTTYIECNKFVVDYPSGLTCDSLTNYDPLVQQEIITNFGFTISLENVISKLSDPTICDSVKLAIAQWEIENFLDPKFIEFDPTETKQIKRCLCDKDLYIYENITIPGENGVADNSPKGQTGGEGGQLFYNYIIENDGDRPPSIFPSYESWKDRGSNSLIINNPNKDTSNPAPNIPVVAFLDSGLNPDIFSLAHYPRFSNITCLDNDQYGYNFVNEDTMTFDDNGHGTLVAASFKYVLDYHNSSSQYYILPVKVLDRCSNGTVFSITCGLYYAQKKGADIINASWGLYEDNSTIRAALEAIAADSIVVVMSAGNRGLDLDVHDHYPSEYSNVNEGDFKYFYEVGALCLEFNRPKPIDQFNKSFHWPLSNFNNKNIVEHGVINSELLISLQKKGIVNQDTILTNLNCACAGTSYAAPRISAAFVNESNLKDHDDIVDEYVDYWDQ